MQTRRVILSAIAAFPLVFATAGAAFAKSATEIDAEVKVAIRELYRQFPAAEELAGKAAGILVFPSITKGGFVLGGEYGEGALLTGGQTRGYYSSASLSIGFQAGLQSRSQVLMFLTKSALDGFLRSGGWEAGVDASVTILDRGTSGQISTEKIKDPVVGFIYGEDGLMAGVSLDGTKITRLEK